MKKNIMLMALASMIFAQTAVVYAQGDAPANTGTVAPKVEVAPNPVVPASDAPKAPETNPADANAKKTGIWASIKASPDKVYEFCKGIYKDYPFAVGMGSGLVLAVIAAKIYKAMTTDEDTTDSLLK